MVHVVAAVLLQQLVQRCSCCCTYATACTCSLALQLGQLSILLQQAFLCKLQSSAELAGLAPPSLKF